MLSNILPDLELAFTTVTINKGEKKKKKQFEALQGFLVLAMCHRLSISWHFYEVAIMKVRLNVQDIYV